MKKITKNSKIRLVELQATEFGKLNAPLTYDFYSFFKLPPRALPNLSAVLKSEYFTDIKMMSPVFHGKHRQFTQKNYNELNNSDVVLISAISRTAPPSMELADKIKSENPNITLIAGGMDPSYRIKDWLKHVDIIVRGEGERTIRDLINRLTQDSESLEDILGISYNKNGGIIETPERELMSAEEFGNLPLPYYDEKIIRSARTSVVEQERGCPHDCDFCSVTKTYGRKIRNSSVKKIISELREIEKRNMGESVFFSGDNMAGTPKKSLELTEAIVDAGLYKRPKVAQVSAGLAKHPELMQGMINAGIDRICVGFESIFDDSLIDMNKPFSADENTNAAEIFRSYGFWIHAMMMVTEKETPERIKEIVKWTKKYADSMQLFIKTPLPGTPYYKKMELEGRILTKDFSLYDCQYCLVRPDTMSPYDLQKVVIDGYKDLYSVKSTTKRLKRSPHKLLTAEFMSYALLGGINKIIESPQMNKHLEFLKLVS